MVVAIITMTIVRALSILTSMTPLIILALIVIYQGEKTDDTCCIIATYI